MSNGIVVVGSCMIDFTSYAARLPLPGETICGKTFQRSFGGKGANQCVTAARLGADTSLVASLGSDIFGAEYLKLLKSENVNVSHVTIKKNVSSGTAQILVADNGENSIVIVMGANAQLSTANVDAAENTIKSASVLLCQFESCLETTLHALKLYKGNGWAKKLSEPSGISILNGAPAVEKPDPELLKTCSIFCVNESEVLRDIVGNVLVSSHYRKTFYHAMARKVMRDAEVMTGIRPLTLNNAQQAIDSLLDKGCNTVILTLGAEGAVYAFKNDRVMIHVSTEKVQPVDTTGAGDSFLGAFAYFTAYQPELSIKESIRRACQIATRSVLIPGTQPSFPYREALPDELFL